ncbi:MAG: hypothetical protein KAU29_01690 [Gammaproteobacteria bacterium]|nr:hypothetical protein [Gammaproteobacteria bacterium]
MKKTTQTKLDLFPRLTTLLFTLFCLTAANQAFAAEDDYLRALEGESGSNRSSGTASSKSGDSYLDALSDEADSSAQVHSGKTHDESYYKNQQEMVETLRLERPSTYKFYTKLTPKNKIQVFEKYSADDSDTGDRLSRLQKIIMDLYFKK